MTQRSAVSAMLSIAIIGSGLVFSNSVFAGAAEVVYLPIVENGETEIEYRGGWRTFDHGREEHANIIELGRGVNDHWFTELELEQAYEDGGPNKIEAFEWENIFALTERGKYWADLGLFASYEHTFSSSPDGFKIGPMFMKDIGPITANVNLLFEHEVGKGASHATGLGYTWQARWRGSEAFEVGAQGFGALGTLGHLGQDQSHIAGPAIFGEKRFGQDKLKWNAAVLAGLDNNAPDVTVRTQIEFEMH